METFGLRDHGRPGLRRPSKSLIGLLCALAMLLGGMIVTGTAQAEEAAADTSGDVTLDWNWGGHTPDEAEGVDPVLKGTRDGDAWVPDLGDTNATQLELFESSFANMNGEGFGINGWNSKPDGSGDWYDFSRCYDQPCASGQEWVLVNPTTKDGKVKYPADGKLYLQHARQDDGSFDPMPTPQLYYAKDMAELRKLKIHANGWKDTQFTSTTAVTASDVPNPTGDDYWVGLVNLSGFRVSPDGTAVVDFGTLMSENPKLESLAEKAFGDPQAKYLTLHASWGAFAVIRLREPADPKLNTADSPRFGSDIQENGLVTYGDQYDPLKGITAKDASGADLTDKIKVVDNPVDTSKNGDYVVTYTVEDAKGNKASMIRNVGVSPGSPKFSDLTEANHRTDLVPVDHVNSNSDKFDLNVGTDYAGQRVTIYITSKENAEHDSYSASSILRVPDNGVLKNWNVSDRGLVYVVVVPWSDPSKLVWDTLTSGADHTDPEIRGAWDTTVDLNTPFDLKAGVSAWDREQGDLTGKITINDSKLQPVSSFDTSKEGLYELNYHVSDGTHDTRWSRVVNVVPAGSNDLKDTEKTLSMPSGPVRAGSVMDIPVGKDHANESGGVMAYSDPDSAAAADRADTASVAGLYAARAGVVSKIVLTSNTKVDAQGYMHVYVPTTVQPGKYRLAVTLPGKLMWNDGLEILPPLDRPMVDKSGLQARIEAAKQLDPANYPNTSFQALNDAVRKAESVLNDPNADQKAVDDALNEVKSAMDAITNPSKPEPGQKVPVTAITVTGQQSLTVGESTQLAAKVEPDEATDKTVSWSSSDEQVATVDKNTGVVTAKAAGEATIKATANDGSGVSGELEVTVTAKTPSKVDKTDLDKTVKDIENAGLKQSDYTADSWKAFQDALDKAKTVQKNDNATQEQVDDAVKALTDAKNGLKKPTPSQPSGPSTPSQPSAPEVSSRPNKLEYRIGEQFDATGMVVKYQGHVLGPDQYTVTLDTSKPGKVKAFITLDSDPTKATSFEVTVVVSDVEVHRLYNKWNGEHFYTANEVEYRALVKANWTDEGTAFTMADYGTPVYRLYLPGGKHLFTTSEKERDALKAGKWRYEGIAFHVRDDGTAKTEVYRLYNPWTGDHLLTANANERGVLALNKWHVEGTAFQAK